MAYIHDAGRIAPNTINLGPQPDQNSNNLAQGATGQSRAYLDVASNAAQKATTMFGWGASLLSSTTSYLTQKGTELKDAGWQVGKQALEKGGGSGLQLANNVMRVGYVGASMVSPGFAQNVERMTVFGTLPNTPKFETALQEKTATLAPMFNAATQHADPGMRAILSSLKDAHGATSVRGGKPTDLSDEQFSCALLLGAHFVKPDGGALYTALRSITDGNGEKIFQQRDSSHYGKDPSPQFGSDLPDGLGHLLIGKIDTGDTFFQLESHGVGGQKTGWDETLGHLKSYAQHLSSDDHFIQMGPQGCIAASEKDGQHIVLQ